MNNFIWFLIGVVSTVIAIDLKEKEKQKPLNNTDNPSTMSTPSPSRPLPKNP